MRSRPTGYTGEEFVSRQKFDDLVQKLFANDRELPDGIKIRRVADLAAVPQARTNFGQGGGGHTTITTLPIDHRAGRSCR